MLTFYNCYSPPSLLYLLSFSYSSTFNVTSSLFLYSLPLSYHFLPPFSTFPPIFPKGFTLPQSVHLSLTPPYLPISLSTLSLPLTSSSLPSLWAWNSPSQVYQNFITPDCLVDVWLLAAAFPSASIHIILWLRSIHI